MLREHEIAGSNPAILTFDCGGTRVGTGRRLLTALTQVRFLPPQLCDTEGQANWRWQPPRKRSSDEPWGFDSLTFRLVRPWPSGKGTSLPSWRGGFDSRRALWNVIGDRLAVGFLALNQATKVRPLLPELARASRVSLDKRCGVI